MLAKLRDFLFVHPYNLAFCECRTMTISWLKSCEQYEELSLGPKPIVIMFWAAWCEPCKHITPTFESLSDETIGLSFLLVDVDDKAFGLELLHYSSRGLMEFVLCQPFKLSWAE
ncbi:hypothetical protein Pst134EA_015425 [Puccinia striiformis f. sp. tritici]|uniref:hypothetical protein n=1 Tax=Puccinia striiformis f. sp. tritici TaxID=168172 RepID=UPI002007FC65|nr:hypothetical protein Pst134EA_015425 [Puccinia striiformis f. sp. tritici]KAH9463342.1 hypothetical protein Pst134EA_015425 [Puccinia striiformis f. sp. tritici]